MKRFYLLATAMGLGVFSAVAQEPASQIRMKIEAEKVAASAAQARIVGVRSALIGQTVKNAPYSAVELTEATQVLADGTRIHNETRTTVYRDAEGRLRRETPTEVTIWDPVANASFVLDPQKMTARKINVGTFTFITSGTGGGTMTNRVEFRGSVATAGVPATTADKLKLELTQKAAAEAEALRREGADVKFDVAVPSPEKVEVEYHATSDASAGTVIHTTGGGIGGAVGPINSTVMVRRSANPPVVDQLGKQVIEGVNADGTRTTSTIETGAIGNDRPLKIVSERWYSSDLQTVVMSKQTDPRSGEEGFRLINVSRAEPAAYLFQVPAAYQMLDK